MERSGGRRGVSSPESASLIMNKGSVLEIRIVKIRDRQPPNGLVSAVHLGDPLAAEGIRHNHLCGGTLLYMGQVQT